MNHAEIQDGLSDYLDGASSAAERASVEAHLLGCAECRGELSLYRRADAALGRPKAPTSFATESFVRAVLRRLEPSPEALFLMSLFASPRRAAAAFFLVLAAFAALLSPARVQAHGPAASLLISQDGGRTYEWLSKPDDAAEADALALEAK